VKSGNGEGGWKKPFEDIEETKKKWPALYRKSWKISL
jgi:hypothetical protein